MPQRSGFARLRIPRAPMGREKLTRTQFENQAFYNRLDPQTQQAVVSPDVRVERVTGYKPQGYWQDPKAVARAYQTIQAAPDPAALPQWMQDQKGDIEFAYKWFEQQNEGKPWTEWGWLNQDDPAREALGQMQAPPSDWLEPAKQDYSDPSKAARGEIQWSDMSPDVRRGLLANPNFDITEYPDWMHSQILSDPAFDWSRLPTWQRTYYDLSSNPMTMGATQGALMGIGGGPVGSAAGAVLGGTLGWAATATGYDPTKEFWQQSNIWGSAFGMMNWPVEQVEKTLGLMKQIEGAVKEPQNFGTVGDIMQNLPAAYAAGGAYFEQMPSIFGGKDYVLGRAQPIDRPRIYQTLTDIRNRIIAGESGRVIVQESSQFIGGQLSDMVLQAAADPMNFLPEVTNKVAAKVAEVTGNDVWAEAFRSTEGLTEAGRKYQTLVQTGEAMVIDPTFKLDEMGAVSRFVAGINEQGQIKAGPFTEAGLLEKPSATNWLQEQVTLTPEARAHQGVGLFYENIGAMLSMFNDPTEIGKYIKGLAANDLSTWAEMGSKIAQSPEWYTVLPALKDFSFDKVDALVNAWEMTGLKRDSLTRLADILGQEPATLLEDLAKQGTAEQDFVRITERLQQSTAPEAKSFLKEIEAGRFTPSTLADIVKVFTGDASLPWHPNQWKALLLDQLGAHFDQWVVDRLGLADTPDAKNAFFRTSHLLKSAQSILLLGGSPGYALQNGMSNMVHRAATGIYGYLTPNQITTWMDRFGVEPSRLNEGVGMGGAVEMAPNSAPVHTEAITKAAQGSGSITEAHRAISSLGKLMPFNKLSGWFEQMESRQGFTIAMRDFWSQSWRRGVGFHEMPSELVGALQSAGYNPEHIYAAIEAGMNQGEVEKALFAQSAGMQARELVHDAAQRAGIPSSDAARILEKVGVLDALDAYLSKADTPDKVQAAFNRTLQRAQDEIDMTYSRDLQARVEFASQKVGAEGATALLDLVVDTTEPYITTWYEHLMRMGKLWDGLDDTMNPEFNMRVVENAYGESNAAFRRINSWQASTWEGVLKNQGMLESDFGRGMLSAMADSDKALGDAYQFMLDEKRQHIETHGRNPKSKEAAVSWAQVNKRTNERFDAAFAMERAGNEKMRDLFQRYYTDNHGPAAGEVARQMWQDVIDFRADMLKRMKTQRQTGMQLSRDFYPQVYMPMVIELGRIKQEGAAKLYQAVTGRLMPNEIEQLSQAAQTRIVTEQAAVSAVWDVAERYSKMQAGNSSNYSRQSFQDKHSLLATLKKEEYGGDPSITDLTDAARKLTPEKVADIFEARKAAKETTLQAENAARELRLQKVRDEAAAKAAARKSDDNVTMLQAIKKHGGIDWNNLADITGENTAQGFPPGTFSKTGKERWALDQMARLLADDGYPINLDDPADLGGVNQTIELLRRARQGEKIYPVGHDHSILSAADQAAEIAAAEMRAADHAALYDMNAWKSQVGEAANAGDFAALADLTERIPEEIANTPHDQTGETYAEYVSRVWDETTARVNTETTDRSLAEGIVRSERAHQAETAAGETALTRQMFREKLSHEFGLPDEQADAVMSITDGRAEGWAKANGKTADEWYSTHLADVVRGGEGDLAQGIEPVNRRMSSEEVGNYARALVRSGSDELRRAVQNEPNPADRVAILDAAHNLDPRMAEDVARQTTGMYQADTLAKKGAVTFAEDGRAIIHAFESADISTAVHEIGHIFRRDLEGADLATIEEWAGVKDGVWERTHEEKFARGFERYLAEGNAPTPKLKAVFDKFKTWLVGIYKSITGSAIDVNLTEKVKAVFDRLVTDEPRKSMMEQMGIRVDEAATRANAEELRQSLFQNDPAFAEKLRKIREARQQAQSDTLFQEATQPPGAYDQAADQFPNGPVSDEGWQRHVRPLLEAMQESAIGRLSEKTLDGARDLSPEGQAMLMKYMRQVQGEMATSKLATVRWGEKQRDFALLNYNRRYGFDRTLETVYPYEFFYTHSILPWAMRAIDKPTWFTNYARLRNQQNRYTRDIPERLRNKIKIPAPWLPDWMGDALYIDPLSNLFTPANFLRPFEQMAKDKTQQQLEAERVLQEWSADQTVSAADIQQAAQTHAGPTWERALAEASIRRESEIANPFDFMNTMLGPAWYLSTPYKLLTGQGKSISPLPLTNTARAVQTVTAGTWAEPIGQLIGLIGKPEEWARQKLNLPEFGEYGDYYTDRQLANMVADGVITSAQAQQAMIERTGTIFDQARQRVQMEMAMRVPLASVTYAGLHEGAGAAAQAALPSLFGAGLLPAGELEYRGLKQEWNDAWKKRDAGDTQAVQKFFDAHPEYEAYLAKGKPPEERLKSFLVGQIWDGYMALGVTDQKQARMMLGDEFSQSFLNKETRSYDTLDVQKLTTWARMLNMITPRTTETAPVLDNPSIPSFQPLDPAVTAITDRFFTERSTKFPRYYVLQAQYYNLPKSERAGFLMRWPELKDYFSWKKGYYNQYPDLVPVFNGEAFKTIDTSSWPPMLIDAATSYAITGDRLPSGAADMLRVLWIREGMPYGDFTSWLNNDVAPSMLNVGYR